MLRVRIIRDFAIGLASSSAVVMLDRLGVFKALLGLRLADVVGEGLRLTDGRWNSVVVMTSVFFLVFLFLRRYRSAPGVVLLRGRTKVPHKVGTYSVYYPITFEKVPHLNFSIRGSYQSKIVEQRPDGFVVHIQSLTALRLFEEGCIIAWRAEGVPAQKVTAPNPGPEADT